MLRNWIYDGFMYLLVWGTIIGTVGGSVLFVGYAAYNIFFFDDEGEYIFAE